MKLWLATQNPHKVEEISDILGDEFRLKSLLDLPDFPEIDENGISYLENAAIKARQLWKQVREPVFADDSGLEVDFLNGRPGILSSRYSAPNPTHSKNIDKLLEELKNVPAEKRTARFRCVVVYIDVQGREKSFEGILEGKIGFQRKGNGGFGFDPVFCLCENGYTLAELPSEEKNNLSHRGNAVKALRDYLKNQKNS